MDTCAKWRLHRCKDACTSWACLFIGIDNNQTLGVVGGSGGGGKEMFVGVCQRV